MNYSFICTILIIFCTQVVFTKHTLNVDTIVPASASTITLREVDAEVIYADSADIQFIEVDKSKTTGLVVNTQGPTSFGGSSISLDSSASVNITAGSTLIVTTPETLSLKGEHLNAAADRFFSRVGGDFFLNTEGSISGHAWDTGITSDNDVDLHVATGVLEALAGDTFQILGDQIEFIGDDKISLYSFSMLSIEAVDDFESYADFIDFDSYGDIYLTSSTGNIELDSVFNIVFEGDVITATAPEGIDFKTEHGSIYVNAKDELVVNSAQTIYLDAFDEIHYLSDKLFSIDADTFNVITGERIEINAKTAEIGWGSVELRSYSLRADTGGNIVLSLGGLTGNSKYNFNASEHIDFKSKNVFGTSDRLLISARQDLEIEVQDQIGSELIANSDTEVLLYGGRNFASKNSRYDFQSGETRVNGDSIHFFSQAIVENQLNFEAGSLIQATGESIIGSAETGIWKASGVTSINSGTFVYSGGIERDDLLFIDGTQSVSLLSNTKITIESILGELLFEASEVTLNHQAASTFTSREDTIILAPSKFTITAGSSVTVKSNEAVYEMNDLTYNAHNSVFFTGNFFDLWASLDGSYTAQENINWNADGDVNVHAFADIFIENILSLVSPVVNFEAVESADFTGYGGISFQNSGTFDLLTGSRSDFTFNGNKVTVSASSGIHIDAGFVYMSAVDDILFSGVNDFSIDTVKEENVLLNSIDFSFHTSNAMTFGSDDDILISMTDTFSEITTIAQNFIAMSVASGIDWVSASETSAVVTNDIAFNAFQDLHILSSGGFLLSSNSLHYDIDRDLVSSSQGAFELTSSAISVDSGGDISYLQNPAIANDDTEFAISSHGTSFTTTGSFSQTGGTTELSTNQFDWESSKKILHSSIYSSIFDANGSASDILFDASVEDGSIRIESDDFHANGAGSLLQQGGYITYSSTDSEPIKFTGHTSVYIESNAAFPIVWNANEDWNVTALGSLNVLAHNVNDEPTGINIINTDDVMSDISFIARNGELEIHSLLTQLFQSSVIEFIAGRDIHWSNFYSPADVGGVSITSSGSTHDGYYQDDAGIVLRSILPFGTIDFNVPRGQIDIDSGYDIRQIIHASASNFTADDEITFWTKGGYFHLVAEQGQTSIISEHQSVTFTTNKNTEIKSHDSISVVAGKEIQLVATTSITDPNHDISFEFSANNGNILVKNQAGFDISFEGEDFYSTSAENSTFLASSNIPIVSQFGSISGNGDTGLYKTVNSGDLYLTSSNSVNVASSQNSDIRVLSGENSNWSAGDKINITSEINGQLRSARGNILLRTNDTTGDLQINSQGEIKIQSDGAAGNNQHGIFVIASEISTYATRGTYVDAEDHVTIGSVTRPIIQFEAGGDSKQNGVTFTSEGNVLQTAGFDFNMNANGYFNIHTNQELDLASGGSATVTALGTHPHGKNVVFQSDGELKLTAGDVQIHGEERSVVRGDELIEFKTTAAASLISFNIANDLISDINSTLNIDASFWNTVSTNYYNIFTFGAVEFANPTGSGLIDIAADSFLVFSSNVDMDWKTVSPGSSLSISSLGSNSNMEFRAYNELSDILFKTNNTLTIESQNDFTIESTNTASITAPLTKTGNSDNSNIFFDSVDDIVYESGFDLFVQSIHSLTISATDPGGAEIDIDSDGELLIQSWQDSYFTSLTNEISFIADYNITFRTVPGNGGSILLNSTRDIVSTYKAGSPNSYVLGNIGGDFSITAARSFEVISFDEIDLTTVGADSNILFDAKTGRINIEVDDVFGDTGEAHSAANAITINSQNFYLQSSGIHNSVDFISDQGLITFDTGDDFNLFTGSFTYYNFYPIESRNGHGYIDFLARGGSSSSISITANNGDVDVTSSAYTNLWSSAAFNITAGDSITFANGFYDGNVIISANSPGGNIEIYATDEFSIDNSAAEGDINFIASHEIGIFPFDNLSFEASGQSTDDKDSGIVFETNHAEADFIMFTTDFLTADININAESYNSYSRDATTYLLLDDDDTQFVGTYLFDAVSIKFSAESDITVQETVSGDIQIDTVGGRTYFTAGGNIIMNVREQTLLRATRAINVDVADNINFVQQEMTITTNVADISFFSTDDIIFVDNTQDLEVNAATLSFSLNADATDINAHSFDLTFGSLTQDLSIIANGAAADILFIGPNDTDQRTTVDFKDGLVIPIRNQGSAQGQACATARDFFYDEGSERFCMCNVNFLLICIQAYTVDPIASFG